MKKLKIETSTDLINEIYQIGLNSNPITVEDLLEFINSETCTQKIINTRAFKGNTPLYAAISMDEIEVVKALIKKGAVIDIVYNEMTPLMSAIMEMSYEDNNTKIINCLIDAGSSLKPTYNQSPFNLACYTQKNEAIRKMIPLGVDLNFKDKHGKTAIEHLEYTGNEVGLKIVQTYLLQKSLQEELSNNNHELNTKPKL